MHVTFLFGLIVVASYDETEHGSRVITLQANTSGKQSRVRIAGGNLAAVTY